MNCGGGRVFTLEEKPFEIIAGDSVPLTFQVLKTDGDYVNLQLPGTKIEWVMFPFEDHKTLVLKKDNGDIGGITVSTEEANMFQVDLVEADTLNLDGAFTFQAIITDSTGIVSRRVQGYMLIWPNGPTN